MSAPPENALPAPVITMALTAASALAFWMLSVRLRRVAWPRPLTGGLLKVMIAVAEERSFRRAAERLHITQPPLSRQIAELEAAFGQQLLTRDSQGVSPTAAGLLAQQEFTQLLADFDRMIERVAAGAGRAPRPHPVPSTESA
jgi:hypothetical protein